MKKDLRQRVGRSIDRLPAPSAGAGKLLSALSKKNVELRELVAIIQRDPLLTPRVLEVANSATFARLKRIRTVEHAAGLLGLTTLRRHAIKWAIGGFLRSLPAVVGWPFETFSLHSEATAMLADSLALCLHVRSAESAFVAGLVHDVGKFILYSHEPDAMNLVVSLRDMSGSGPAEVEREVFGIDHAEVSSMAAERWRLDEEVVRAVRWHHEPERDPGTEEIQLSRVLAKSDAFVNGLGLNFFSTPVDATSELEWPGQERRVKDALKSFAVALSHGGIEPRLPKKEEAPEEPHERCDGAVCSLQAV